MRSVMPFSITETKEESMSKLIAALVAGLFCVSVAQAQDKKPVDQKQKMSYCNKEAGANKLKGDERKKFMSACLKG